MTSVYVAASSAEMERARAAIRALRLAGCEVYDWTLEHVPTPETTRTQRRDAERACTEALVEAEVVLVLAPTVRSDALVEFGIAIGRRSMGSPVRIVVAGPVAARGIFAESCEVYESDVEAIAAVVGGAREAAE